MTLRHSFPERTYPKCKSCGDPAIIASHCRECYLELFAGMIPAPNDLERRPPANTRCHRQRIKMNEIALEAFQ